MQQADIVSPETAAAVNAAGLAERWWTLALRGIAASAFGVIALFAPGTTPFSLMYLFGAYAFMDGAFNLVHLHRSGLGGRRWGVFVLQGIAGIVAGVLAFVWPEISTLALAPPIASWAVVTGILELAAAVRLRKQICNESLLGLSGVLSIVLGALMFLFPEAGALTLVLWIGAYALVSGILLLALSFKLRSLRRRPPEQLFLVPRHQDG